MFIHIKIHPYYSSNPYLNNIKLLSLISTMTLEFIGITITVKVLIPETYSRKEIILWKGYYAVCSPNKKFLFNTHSLNGEMRENESFKDKFPQSIIICVTLCSPPQKFKNHMVVCRFAQIAFHFLVLTRKSKHFFYVHELCAPLCCLILICAIFK